MLRISHYWNPDFDEQWNEMIALKKSRDLVICCWRLPPSRNRSFGQANLPHLCSAFLPLYGSGMENAYPLESAQVTSISDVAFSLRADKSDCFFTVYPAPATRVAAPPSESQLAQRCRFQHFKEIFQLEASQLCVRQVPEELLCGGWWQFAIFRHPYPQGSDGLTWTDQQTVGFWWGAHMSFLHFSGTWPASLCCRVTWPRVISMRILVTCGLKGSEVWSSAAKLSQLVAEHGGSGLNSQAHKRWMLWYASIKDLDVHEPNITLKIANCPKMDASIDPQKLH